MNLALGIATLAALAILAASLRVLREYGADGAAELWPATIA